MSDAAFGLLAVAVTVEIAARTYRSARHGLAWHSSLPLPSPRVLSFDSHPYALYVLKPQGDGLWPSNELGYAGKRDIVRARVPNSVRIYCVGGSTVQCHDPASGPDSSWPGRLQDLLAERFAGTRIECINAGVAGYTSAESLSEFLFRGIDLQPDIVLVYHNVNDAWTCQMVDGFKPDYSHARRHKPWTVGWINRLPQVPWLVSYQTLRDRLTRWFGKANALVYWFSDPPWKSVHAFNPEAVKPFRRNITNLVRVAQSAQAVPVLLRWECDWSARRLPPHLEEHPDATDAYFAFLEANNVALAQIAQECDCPHMTVGPFAPDHFVDTIHFSPLGLQEMARRVADQLEPIVRSTLGKRLAEASGPWTDRPMAHAG